MVVIGLNELRDFIETPGHLNNVFNVYNDVCNDNNTVSNEEINNIIINSSNIREIQNLL